MKFREGNFEFAGSIAEQQELTSEQQGFIADAEALSAAVDHSLSELGDAAGQEAQVYRNKLRDIQSKIAALREQAGPYLAAKDL